MKAVVLDDRNQFSVAEVPEPVPGPGQVAIRVAYAGIQWGDVLVRDGHFPVPRPFTPGFEAAGQVIAAGTGVEDVSVGDSVIALTSAGAFAELAVAPAVLTLPASGLDLRTAAASGWTTPTAYDLISTVSRVRPGDRVLIHAAAGAVGTMAAQFARRAGAGTVTGVAGDPARAAYAASFGYDRVLTRSEFPQALGGESFDVILDPVGGPARHANLNLLAPHGRLAVYGNIAHVRACHGLRQRPAHDRGIAAHLQQQPAQPDQPCPARRKRPAGAGVPSQRPGEGRHHRRVRDG